MKSLHPFAPQCEHYLGYNIGYDIGYDIGQDIICNIVYYICTLYVLCFYLIILVPKWMSLNVKGKTSPVGLL